MSVTYPPETNNGLVTSWIPLTTGWSDLDHCSSAYVLYTSTSGQFVAAENGILFQTTTISDFVAFDYFWGIAYSSEPRCVPKEVTSWRSQFSPYGSESDRRTLTGPILSLMPLRCPDAWSTVATFIKSSISTQAMCCPPSYLLLKSVAHSTGVEGVCVSTIEPKIMLTYVEYAPMSLTSPISPYKPSVTTVDSKITAEAAAIVGWNVQPTALPSSTALSSSDLTQTLLSSNSTQTPSSPPANGHELSGGVKVGIGASVGVSIFIIVAVITWAIILKRKNRNLSAQIKTSHGSSQQIQSSDRTDDPYGIFNQPPQPSELAHSHIINELDRGSLREIDGSQINELSHRSLLLELDTIPAAV